MSEGIKVLESKINAWAGDILEKILGNDDTGLVRVYISGPMTGIDEFNRPAFRAAAWELMGHGFEVRNPADIRVPDDSREDYMRADLMMLLGCDIIILLPGWEKSQGALVELAVARSIGIAVFMYETGDATDAHVRLTPIQPMKELASEVQADQMWRGESRK